MITIKDFMKCDIIIAQIKEAQEHPDADKLYVLKVDTGTEERQLVAGIRAAYTKEELVGRQIAMVSNLEPAVIRGVESQGMLLAGSDANGIVLLSPEKPLALGSRVR